MSEAKFNELKQAIINGCSDTLNRLKEEFRATLKPSGQSRRLLTSGDVCDVEVDCKDTNEAIDTENLANEKANELMNNVNNELRNTGESTNEVEEVSTDE